MSGSSVVGVPKVASTPSVSDAIPLATSESHRLLNIERRARLRVACPRATDDPFEEQFLADLLYLLQKATGRSLPSPSTSR
ncbi:MAG: hypothetical protein H3C62_01235 [Gemmatimonadaceae bacterium]|nr:hypothetical protein [Gemmatimonadaceae bacterium]